jgi:hypothetical protein
MDKRINEFANKYWQLAANHKKGEHTPYDAITVADLTPEQSHAVKLAGDDIIGYAHIISSDFVAHFYNRHGNAAKEKSNGNLPVTADNLAYIPHVLAHFDFIVTGIVFKNEKRILYGKYNGGTTIFVEQVQTRKKELAGRSFFIADTKLTAESLLEKFKADSRYNVESAKITSGGGGNPPDSGDPNAVRSVANPKIPLDA